MNYQNLLNKNIIDSNLFLLNYYHLINLSEVELVVILQIELMLKQNQLVTNKELEARMNINSTQIDKVLNNLLKKKYITFDNYNPNKLIDTTNIYLKIIEILESKQIITNEQEERKDQTNVIKTFESEFNRHLTPIEIEMIKDWYENYSNELIIYALKEAVLNGILNFKYIDKIITEQGRLING